MENKKRTILASTLAGLLLVSVLLFLGLREVSPKPTEPTAPSAQPSEPAATTVPTAEPPTEPTVPQEPAKVVIWQHDEALLEAWQSLADAYTAKTGVEVIVKVNQFCSDSLHALGQEDAPTIFCLHDLEDPSVVEMYCLDLTGDPLLQQLCRDSFTLSDEKGVWGIASNIESYGLIYNASLLARTGYTVSDIKDYASLSNVVQHITKDQKTLGFSAFTAADLQSTYHGSLLCLLAGLQGSNSDLRSFWDLYTKHDLDSDNGLQDFLDQKTVFFLGGTWDYDTLASLTELVDNNLQMLPVYTPTDGENLGLYHSCTGYWSVNKQAEAKDVEASLRFLRWLVTADASGNVPVDALGLLSPYKDAKHFSNPLEEVVREYLAMELQDVDWNSCDELTEDRLAALGKALAIYEADPGDDTWEKVEAIWQE